MDQTGKDRPSTSMDGNPCKALPHPFPELLTFDNTGEPTLKSHGDIDSTLWLTHDRWYGTSCQHSGCLIERHLGNIASVAYVREFLENNSPKSFPLLLERVVYSGSHSGDSVAASEAMQLLTEIRMLRGLTTDPTIVTFANDLTDLAEASIASGNPIAF